MTASDPTVVAAVHRALAEQTVLVLIILAATGLAAAFWAARRARADRALPPAADRGSLPPAEASARRLLRVGFGALWIIDGALQLQPSMALGVVPRVIQPAASGSPGWARHLASLATATWSYHPVSVASAIVWVEIGLGAGLVMSSRGDLSRLFGILSACWALVAWALGEAFGGLSGRGASWLGGAPGAALFYAVAGLLVALPAAAWESDRFVKRLARATGVFCCALAVLQAWPGRGTWRGGIDNPLAQMLRGSAAVHQPHLLAALVGAFARFDAAHGPAVNLLAVLGLLAVGGAFLTARRRAVVAGAVAGVAFCLAVWVLVQDLGVFGGTSTNPQSMLPMALLLVTSCLAVARRPDRDTPWTTGTSAPVGGEQQVRRGGRQGELLRPVGALGALAVVLVGAVPMGLATLNPRASPVLTDAINGPPTTLDVPAAGFTLEDQHGQVVSLSSLRGRVVALTFLDDVCTTDCPIIAQEFRTADSLLGSDAGRVELVAINANPRYTSPAFLDAFDQQEHLADVPNWRFLTASLPELEQVWARYGMTVEVAGGGAMIMHSDYTYVIDARGHTRLALGSDPGPGTQATQSSFAVTLAGDLRQVLRES